MTILPIVDVSVASTLFEGDNARTVTVIVLHLGVLTILCIWKTNDVSLLNLYYKIMNLS